VIVFFLRGNGNRRKNPKPRLVMRGTYSGQEEGSVSKAVTKLRTRLEGGETEEAWLLELGGNGGPLRHTEQKRNN